MIFFASGAAGVTISGAAGVTISGAAGVAISEAAGVTISGGHGLTCKPGIPVQPWETINRTKIKTTNLRYMPHFTARIQIICSDFCRILTNQANSGCFISVTVVSAFFNANFAPPKKYLAIVSSKCRRQGKAFTQIGMTVSMKSLKSNSTVAGWNIHVCPYLKKNTHIQETPTEKEKMSSDVLSWLLGSTNSSKLIYLADSTSFWINRWFDDRSLTASRFKIPLTIDETATLLPSPDHRCITWRQLGPSQASKFRQKATKFSAHQ